MRGVVRVVLGLSYRAKSLLGWEAWRSVSVCKAPCVSDAL